MAKNAVQCQKGLSRDQRKQARIIRQAHFRLSARVQAIDYEHPRNISQTQIARLAQSDWIHRAQNLLLTGPCGSGKPCLAGALGHNTCLHGYTASATIASHDCSKGQCLDC